MTRMAKNWTEDIVGIVRMQDNLFGFGDLRTFRNRISVDFHCLSLSLPHHAGKYLRDTVSLFLWVVVPISCILATLPRFNGMLLL